MVLMAMLFILPTVSLSSSVSKSEASNAHDSPPFPAKYVHQKIPILGRISYQFPSVVLCHIDAICCPFLYHRRPDHPRNAHIVSQNASYPIELRMLLIAAAQTPGNQSLFHSLSLLAMPSPIGGYCRSVHHKLN
eukprot:185219_1